jgi:predicted metal-dependent phosphoesterase TrpH
LREDKESKKRWLKAEMHAHCSLDPQDFDICRHTPEQLIREAARQGFDILSITCHDVNIWSDALSDYARKHGITLVPGMEVTVEKTRHTLVYNFDTGPERLNTLDKIRARSNGNTLVVAPHPFFPGYTSLGSRLEENADIFDAVEYSGFVVRGLNFNRRGIQLAEKTGKPILGLGDIHQLWQLGRTYTWIYAEPEIGSILDAVKQGLVRVETTSLSWPEAAVWFSTSLWRTVFPVNPPPGLHAFRRFSIRPTEREPMRRPGRNLPENPGWDPSVK